MTAHDILVERLVRAGKAAGRDALGQVAYQMARRCWSEAASTKERHIRFFEDPRAIADLYSELLVLEARSGIVLEKDDLPLVDPTSEAALKCAHACLDLGVSIEGESARVQLLRAKCIRSQGSTEEAASRYEHLLREPLDKSWYLLARESYQTVLLSLGRYDEAASIGRVLLRLDSSRVDAAFNLLTAQAWMGLASGFGESSQMFRTALEGASDPDYWSRLVSEEAPWLAAKLKRDTNEIAESLSLHHWPPSSQRPGS